MFFLSNISYKEKLQETLGTVSSIRKFIRPGTDGNGRDAEGGLESASDDSEDEEREVIGGRGDEREKLLMSDHE